MARPAGPAGRIPVGTRFNRLEVIGEWSKNDRGAFVYPVRCDCGKETTAIGTNLISGNSQSCGCRKRDASSDAHLKHGETGTRLYRMWVDLRNRCNNPRNQRFADYGERGIRVDPAWDTYESFRDWAIKEGYDEHSTVERKNVNGNYGPRNCTLVPKGMQAQNHRKRKTHHGNEVTSIHRGVYYDEWKGLWVSSIGYNGQQVYLGRYKEEIEAAYAYNVASETLFNEWAARNDLDARSIPLNRRERIKEETARRISSKLGVAS